MAPLAPDKRIAVSLQRTSAGGVAAILRDAPAPVRGAAPFTPPSAATPSGEILQRLNDAEAGRRAAELGRDKAEANATARARFLANMSHELRTPLNAIMGFSDMMRAKMFGELPPKYAEYADLIHESGGHLLDLINDVLDMSKIEAQRYTLSREVFDVREALNAALRLMRLQADDAGVKLRAVLPPDPLMVDADKRAIKQIALNLLSNALKFTPRDGTVILTARATAGLFELVIADTGMGIAADDLKRLGQPFEQAGGSEDRARGTGLGLSLVDAFAKLHGGTMTLESRLGEGTAATVRMPVLAEAAPGASNSAPMESPPEPPMAVVPPVPAPPLAEAEPPPAPAEPELDKQTAYEPPPQPAEPEPPPVESAPASTGSAAPAPKPNVISEGLGPLDSRGAEHHSLRQSVINIFTQRSGSPGDKPDPNRPNNGGVRFLS
jgi:signal transduction histidine kinase